MTILIIGSKGFIGQHCQKYFSEQKHTIFGCDVVTDYAAENYFLIDTVNSDYKEIFENNSFEVCINCSGAAEVSKSIRHPFRDFTLNTLNVFKILDAIRQYQPDCKFINLSSAAVYGNPQYLPIDEKHPANPISPYGFHKLAAENICKEFSDLYGIKTINLRIFSAYGNGLKKQLFWDLFTKTKKSNEIELFGTGNESRDFIHIDDIVQAVDLLINLNNFTIPVINLANGNEIFINSAAAAFYNNYNSSIKYKFNGHIKPGDPLNWKADISVLKLLGYRQTLSFEDGIKQYTQWLEDLE